MKFPKKLVESIIMQELANYIQELAPEKDKKKPKTQDSEQASDEAKPKKDAPPKNKPDPNHDPAVDKEPVPGSPPPEEEEVPDEADPADDELEDGSEDGNEGDDDRGGGAVSDEVVGKRIQSITLEPKSKVVPGAMELVITFDEIPDPLKVLITKTGQVKFYFRGLHNEL